MENKRNFLQLSAFNNNRNPIQSQESTLMDLSLLNRIDNNKIVKPPITQKNSPFNQIRN